MENPEIKRARRRAAWFEWRIEKARGGPIRLLKGDEIIAEDLTAAEVIRLCEELENECVLRQSD